MLHFSGDCSQEDKAASIRKYEEDQASRRALYFALRSRVLTDEEMARVIAFDYHLVIEHDVTYREQEKRDEFSAALLQQFKLRLSAHAAAKPLAEL